MGLSTSGGWLILCHSISWNEWSAKRQVKNKIRQQIKAFVPCHLLKTSNLACKSACICVVSYTFCLVLCSQLVAFSLYWVVCLWILHHRSQLSQPSAAPSFSDIIARPPGISLREEAEKKLLGVGLMELLLSICEKSQLSMAHLYMHDLLSNKISLGKRSVLSHPVLDIILFCLLVNWPISGLWCWPCMYFESVESSGSYTDNLRLLWFIWSVHISCMWFGLITGRRSLLWAWKQWITFCTLK